jgi:uncharacterized SAM-binding protein YcdF (DUF218 family)
MRSCIAIIGNGLTPDEKLPPHVVQRLNVVSALYQIKPEGDKPLLAVTGKWSFWNRKGIPPKTTEAHEMKDILLTRNIPKKDILVEDQSEDTIGNALYLKRLLEKEHPEIKTITFVCADYQFEKAEYIFNTIFGEDYKLKFLATPGPYEGTELERQKQLQRELLARQKSFINELLTNPLPDDLYDLPEYTNQLRGQITETGLTAMARR